MLPLLPRGVGGRVGPTQGVESGGDPAEKGLEQCLECDGFPQRFPPGGGVVDPLLAGGRARRGVCHPGHVEEQAGPVREVQVERLSRDAGFLGDLGHGDVGARVALEDAQQSARSATLSMLASLKRALGDLDGVTAWLTVGGFVNADPGYSMTTLVMNAVSELLIDLYGYDSGSHARIAPGVTGIPFNLPLVVSAEVEVAA